MILDAHTDLVAEATVSDDFQGFFALVEEGSKYPLVSETSFLIRPGHVSNVAIGATQVVATDGIRGRYEISGPLEYHIQIFCS